MKKLTPEEAANIPVKPSGRGSWLRLTLINMKVGDFLLIEPKDWKWKRKTPTTLCRLIERGSTMKFDCGRAMDGSGWVVKRTA